MQMNLKGTFTLDNESEEILRNEMRKNVLDDIAENGCDIDEIVRLLSKLSYKTYKNAIHQTIDTAILNAQKMKEIA